MARSEQNAGERGRAGGCCGQCASEREIPDDPLALRGWRLVVGSCAVFLAPIALAAAGAWRLGPSGTGQLAGALGGLAAGALIARGVLAGIRPRGGTGA